MKKKIFNSKALGSENKWKYAAPGRLILKPSDISKQKKLDAQIKALRSQLGLF